MSTEMIITIGVLIAEIAVFLYCLKKVREPIDPAKPRLMPHTLIMILMMAGIFATTAHVISVATGVRVEPKNRMKGQQ